MPIYMNNNKKSEKKKVVVLFVKFVYNKEWK